MRVIIDTIGAPAQSGGMRVHAQEVVRAWAEQFPSDELIVMGYEWVASSFPNQPNVTPVVLRAEGAPGRFVAQFFTSPFLRRRYGADAILSVSSIVSPLMRTVPTVCFIHDWRHKLKPEEFGFAQRAYRVLWDFSISRASVTLAISEKALLETRRFARPRRLGLVPNGTDHPRHWEFRATGDGSPGRYVLSFGHLSNKRPELAIRAIGQLKSQGRVVELIVVGARGAYAAELAELAKACGVEDHVHFPGFVPDDELHNLVRDASVIALLSSDEGYGFPVVEGAYFGVPVVVTDDSGLADIHPQEILTSVEATPEGVASAFEKHLSSPPRSGPSLPDSAQRKWVDVATDIRREIAVLLSEAAPTVRRRI